MPDYSCYITIDNKLDVALTRTGYGTGHGYWNVNPPSSIGAGTTSAQFQVKDHVGPEGSDGWVTYRVELTDVADDNSKPVIRATFGDPTGNNDNWYTCSCDNNMGNALFKFSNTSFPKRDHPLTVTGTFEYNTNITTTSSVATVKIPSPVLNVYNTQTPPQNRKAANQVVWDSAAPNANNDNTTPGISGSYSPVSIDLAASVSYANVAINVNNDFVGVPFYLQADIGPDTNVLANPNPQYFTTAGAQTIRVMIQPSWLSQSFPWGLAGDAIWSLSVGPTGQSIPITTTRLEIYALTRALPAFFNNQINVRLLRSIVLPARNAGTMDWVQYVVNATFGTYGTTNFHYDVVNGAPHYAEDYYGGNFNLRSWIASSTIPLSLVNCYDQAGIVQICLALVANGSSQWLYQRPSGYISQTNLIGVGQCNNPFYASNGSLPIVGNNDASRTQFGNHSFLAIGSKANQIADASAGPHQATENLQQFVAAYIQPAGSGPNQTTLYTSTGTRPGTAADVAQQAGITQINGGAPTFPALMATKHKTSGAMELAKVSLATASPFINLDVAAIHDVLARKSGFKLLDYYQEISAGGSEFRWVLGSDGVPTTVNVVVLADAEHARSYFEAEISKSQRSVDEIYAAPPRGMEKGQLCLTSPVNLTSHSLMVWVRGNVFARISAEGGLKSLESSFGSPLDNEMSGRACEEEDLIKPVLKDLSGPARSVQAGHEFIIYPSVEECGLATVRSTNVTAVLLSQDPVTHAFRFRAEQPGSDSLHFAFAHIKTGMVVSKDVEVSVVPRME